MSVPDPAEELRLLRDQLDLMQRRITHVEAQAAEAEQEAHRAREETLILRDQIAAAQRDQQDLKTARARLARMRVRSLLTRVLHRQ